MKDRFRVLSLDGGGIRGAFAAAFLEEIEKVIGAPIRRYFDLIAGTSTGGIIALAAAFDEPMKRVLEFYEHVGPRIFKRRPQKRLGSLLRVLRFCARSRLSGIGINFDDFFQTRYEPAVLKTALGEVLGDRTLHQAKTRVVIPAVDLSYGSPVVFKTPHLPEANTRDGRFTAVEIALSTAAAPTYFPHASAGPGSAYIDGGLWANNPILVAIAETMRIRSSLEGVQILSIGTGIGQYAFVPPDGDAGLGWWGSRLLEVMSFSQSQGFMHVAKFLLNGRCERVDFGLPDSTWRLDSAQHIDRLVHFGRMEAHRRLASFRRMFFDEIAEAAANWDSENCSVSPA